MEQATGAVRRGRQREPETDSSEHWERAQILGHRFHDRTRQAEVNELRVPNQVLIAQQLDPIRLVLCAGYGGLLDGVALLVDIDLAAETHDAWHLLEMRLVKPDESFRPIDGDSGGQHAGIRRFPAAVVLPGMTRDPSDDHHATSAKRPLDRTSD